MATRPKRIVLSQGQQSWDTEVDTNFEQLTDAPMPTVRFESLDDLEAAHYAPAFLDCIAVAGGVEYISDGSEWIVNRRASNVDDSTATTVAEMASDFNSLLNSLKSANIMKAW